MFPETPSLATFLANALHIDLTNYMLKNLETAACIRKKENELRERRIAYEVQAELCSLLLHQREKILRVIQLADPHATAAD